MRSRRRRPLGLDERVDLIRELYKKIALRGVGRVSGPFAEHPLPALLFSLWDLDVREGESIVVRVQIVQPIAGVVYIPTHALGAVLPRTYLILALGTISYLSCS